MDKIYNRIDVEYLKSRFIMPETIINEAYLLGTSKGPEKEYQDLLKNDRDKDIIKFDKIIYEVKYYKIV